MGPCGVLCNVRGFLPVLPEAPTHPPALGRCRLLKPSVHLVGHLDAVCLLPPSAFTLPPISQGLVPPTSSGKPSLTTARMTLVPPSSLHTLPCLFESFSISCALFSPARPWAPQQLCSWWSLPSVLSSQGWLKSWLMYPVSSLYPQVLQKRWQKGNKKLLSKPRLPWESRKKGHGRIESPAHPSLPPLSLFQPLSLWRS